MRSPGAITFLRKHKIWPFDVVVLKMTGRNVQNCNLLFSGVLIAVAVLVAKTS